MSAPLKTLVLRLPTRSAGSITTRCCPKAPFTSTTATTTAAQRICIQQGSTTAASPFRSHLLQPQRLSTTTTRALTRASSSLANSASKVPDAAKFKTGSDLATKRPSEERPPAQQPPSNPAGQPLPLDWNTFFKLRTRRRRIQVFFSITTGLLGFAAGMGVLTTGIAEPLVSQVPLDPILTMGLMTFACGGIGWLVGPSIGGELFYLLNRQFRSQIRRKEAEFFSRVKKHRADPENSSAANPVPDFYGEKIQSVQGYRQWLKDQRAFNKKKTKNFV